jgi:hypothetical protein
MPLHQYSETPRRSWSLGYQNQAAGLAVEPIHNRNLTAAGNFERQQLAQFLPQGARAVRLGRMNQQERRFIDDDVIVGFVDDFELEERSNGVLE